MITIFTNERYFSSLPPEVVATVGFFDGVHWGHRFLIEQLRKFGERKNLPTAVITFPVHPRKVLDNGFCPYLLTDFDEKRTHLETTGIDYCFVVDFTQKLSQLPAREFIQQLLYRSLHVRGLLIGYDHRFGKDRKEGIKAYTAYGNETGMEVVEAAPFLYGQMHVSSTVIRKLLSVGNVRKASQMLSYPYTLKGTVILGNQLGRQIGFPTANIRISDPDKLIPSAGIYAVWVSLDNQKHKGMLYIGYRPSINNRHELRIEVNLLDFSGDLYDRTLSIELIEYLREDKKFDTLEDLKNQLFEDKRMTEKVFSDF